MPVIGEQRSFYHKYAFIVEIDGFKVAAFTKAGPLEAEVAVVEVNEGGSLIPTKEPGRVKVSDVVLSRGATDDEDCFSWFKDVANLAANAGLITPAYKRNVDIVQLNRDGTTRKRWRLMNAWPNKFNAGDWDNDADEATVESVTLTFDYFDKAPAA